MEKKDDESTYNRDGTNQSKEGVGEEGQGGDSCRWLAPPVWKRDVSTMICTNLRMIPDSSCFMKIEKR